MRSDDAYLLDTLEASRKARGFSVGLTESQFEKSELHQHAIFNVLEVVGEAHLTSAKPPGTRIWRYPGRKSSGCATVSPTDISVSTLESSGGS